jgi:hypothetical protein
MRFLRRGETTLLEFWQDECRSKCHDMLKVRPLRISERVEEEA